MRINFPKREELEQMSIPALRNLDIYDKDEEELVQEVMLEKSSQTLPVRKIYTGDIPDIKTPEEEAKYQELVDARLAVAKEIELPAVEESTTASDIFPEEEELAKETQEPASEPAPEEPLDAKFCGSCDSKGGRHKKGCPTLNVPN